MTGYSDLKAQIADFANRQDWPDALVSGFIAQATQKFNAELRVDRMIQFDEALITSRCAPLPDDWLEFVSGAGVKIQNDNAADGFLPIRFMARDQFFNTTANWAYGYYTLQGRQIYIGGPPDTVDGQTIKITYYGEVPVFSDTQPSWVYTKYPSLYLYGSLMHADLHAVGEEAQAGAMKQLTEDMIQKLNADHLRSKASGSRVTRPRVRSFG